MPVVAGVSPGAAVKRMRFVAVPKVPVKFAVLPGAVAVREA